MAVCLSAGRELRFNRSPAPSRCLRHCLAQPTTLDVLSPLVFVARACVVVVCCRSQRGPRTPNRYRLRQAEALRQEEELAVARMRELQEKSQVGAAGQTGRGREREGEGERERERNYHGSSYID